MSNSSLVTYYWNGSKTNCNPRDHKIDRITIHMMAGNGSLYTCFSWLCRTGNQGSVNYGIDSNGTIGLMIDEDKRAWTSSNRANDMRAVTIEVANDTGEPNWHVSDKAMASVINLCADICKRNGIKKLEYTGDKTCATGNMSLHKWFAATSCPGPYLESKMTYIANEVNKKLGVTPSTTPTNSTLLNYDQFEKKYLGKAVDYDGTAGVQCVDLADQYFKDCFGITGVWVNGAKDFYNNFNSYPALVKAFNRIANTRDLVVQKGDVVIWGGGSWGHVAIGDGNGNIDWFTSIEQNTLGRHEPTQRVKHYFNNRTGNDGCYPVLGVLRPKDQARIQGGGTFEPYIIQVTYKDGLNIRSGPGTNYSIVGTIPYGGVYTIVEESVNGTQTWGKLKSGAGWICLTGYTTKYSTASKTTTKKSNNEIAKEVIAGKWGSGSTRKKKLTAAGYDYKAIQKIVNQLMKK